MHEILHIIHSMSPFLLLGFFLAGVMHAFVPSRLFTRHLSRPTFASVVKAAAIGIPLPLCSCGVIPTAMSLRREGASHGAVVSFLVATPQTGVDSIIATYSLMGFPFALIRPLVALVTAIISGVAVNILSPASSEPEAAPAAKSCCCHKKEASHCDAPAPRPRWYDRWKEALHYAYIDMMGDIGKWLVIGLAVAGLISVLVPESAFTLLRGNTLASMLLVLVISIPMYLCATGSIPIAVALMMKGLTPGAALVMLMAGPACNMASILVVRKVLGTRTLIIYLMSILTGAIGSGCLVDLLQNNGIIDFTGSLTAYTAPAAGCSLMSTGTWWEWTSTIVLLVLLVYTLVVRKHLHPQAQSACHCHKK